MLAAAAVYFFFIRKPATSPAAGAAVNTNAATAPLAAALNLLQSNAGTIGQVQSSLTSTGSTITGFLGNIFGGSSKTATGANSPTTAGNGAFVPQPATNGGSGDVSFDPTSDLGDGSYPNDLGN